MKSGGFHHEIWQILPWNPWNPVDFTMKSSGFHEICEIHEIWWISPWNLADFMKSGRFQVKSDVSEIRCRCFSKNSSDFTRFGVDFTWNQPDFMKSAGFHTDFMWNRKTFARNCNSMFLILACKIGGNTKSETKSTEEKLLRDWALKQLLETV